MNTFALAFLGGIFGALLMDITEAAMAKFGIRSGVNIVLVSRWCLGMTRGRLAHADIQASSPLPREAGVGWAFHFLIGGGGVALIYPAVLLSTGAPLPGHPLLYGLLFGLATSVLPRFVLLPAFGWGWFSRRGPHLLRPVLSGHQSRALAGILEQPGLLDVIRQVHPDFVLAAHGFIPAQPGRIDVDDRVDVGCAHAVVICGVS